jgi:guanidinopropionase
MPNPPFLPRYMGIPTFMRMPVWQPGEAADIAMVGVPFDGGVTNRPGARHGPREVRNHSSLIRRFSQATGHNPFEAARIVDAGDVHIERPYNLTDAHGDIEAAFHAWRAAGLKTLAVGGDHSVSLPILRAVAKGRAPLGLVHIDAHCDTGDDYAGSRFHHGAPFSRAVEEGLIDPKRTVQIGIRSTLSDLDQWKFSRTSGMRVMMIEEVYKRGIAGAIAEARRVVGDKPCYITFDIDSVDPAFAPGTGTPEVGGLTSLEALLLVRGLSGLNVVSADLVEVAPAYDPTNNTAFLAANILFELLCVMTGQRPPG